MSFFFLFFQLSTLLGHERFGLSLVSPLQSLVEQYTNRKLFKNIINWLRDYPIFCLLLTRLYYGIWTNDCSFF